jgi:hypothetical protein
MQIQRSWESLDWQAKVRRYVDQELIPWEVEAATAHDRGDDVKSLHSQCSIVKLYSTEMAKRGLENI